jgi:diaminopimelate decarboxylase
MFHTKNKNGSLYFSGCEVEKLAKKYGTPLYLVSEDKIRSKCREVRASFLYKYPNTKAFYASKTFLTHLQAIENTTLLMKGIKEDVQISY